MYIYVCVCVQIQKKYRDFKHPEKLDTILLQIPNYTYPVQ